MTEQEKAAIEHQLFEKMMFFEKTLFCDISLSYASNILFSWSFIAVNGELVTCEPCKTKPRTLADWRIEIAKLKPGHGGECDLKSKTIRIDPQADIEPTLVHEALHAYLLQLEPEQTQWLCIFLYCELGKTLSRLDELCFHAAHGPGLILQHDLLFALKSLHCDILMGWQPGRTFGYSRLRAVLGVMEENGPKLQFEQVGICNQGTTDKVG